MRECQDDEDRLKQPPDQTKPTILHQVVIRSTTKPSTQRLSPGPINSKTQRSSRRSPTPKLVPFGPGKLSERPCAICKPYRLVRWAYRGVNHLLEISGDPYKKSEISYTQAIKPFEKLKISYDKCWNDLFLGAWAHRTFIRDRDDNHLYQQPNHHHLQTLTDCLVKLNVLTIDSYKYTFLTVSILKLVYLYF